MTPELPVLVVHGRVIELRDDALLDAIKAEADRLRIPVAALIQQALEAAALSGRFAQQRFADHGRQVQEPGLEGSHGDPERGA
jgi:hypothetical protein